MSAKEVELSGGAPWGFRMHGGIDQNQPLRISRVNPGRKASFSGIREGDLISTINGRPTKTMTNAEAHTMLRTAGPTLKLGLNEDREMSPRRRSIGKGAELKRPSYLIADSEPAILQPPVYATIKQSNLPPNKQPPSPMRMNSLPTTFSSTPLVRAADDHINIHPTNPFYTTLPSNTHTYTSPTKSKPNGYSIYSTLDRSNSMNEYKKPDFYTFGYKTPPKSHDNLSGPQSLPHGNDKEHLNRYTTKDEIKENDFYDKLNRGELPNRNPDYKPNYNNDTQQESLKSERPIPPNDPFDTSHINTDPFERYLKLKSLGNDDIYTLNNKNEVKEEITETSTVTERKISEIEEIKTVKKVLLNSNADHKSPTDIKTSITEWSNQKAENSQQELFKIPTLNGSSSPLPEQNKHENVRNNFEMNHRNYFENNKPNLDKNERINFEKKDQMDRSYSTSNHRPSLESLNITDNSSGALSTDVTSKPPIKSPTSSNSWLSSPPNSKQTVMIAPTFKARSASPAVWKPGSASPAPPEHAAGSPATPVPPPPPLPVWTPGSAGASPISPRKSFRPVHFEETPPPRRKFPNPPLEQNGITSGSESEGRLRTSISAPASGLNSLGASGASRLPRAQNPTVTLLQKAREGQFPRGASYLQQERDSARLPRDRAEPPRGHPVHALRREYASEGEEYERSGDRMSGVGPITQHGMPVALRSEAKDQSRWYKKMYDTIHKNKYDDDYVTIRYKNRRGDLASRVGVPKYAYFDPRSGYLSEPEGSGAGYTARRRTASVQEDRTQDHELTSPYLPSNKYSTLASARASQEVYKNQPGKIENYVPGKSSVVDKEAKQWWDEVMDIFDGWLDENSPLPPYTTLLARAIQKNQLSSTTSLPQALPKEKRNITSAILSKSNMARALKESGYESDSQVIFRRRSETEGPLSPAERRAAYRDLQAGGEPPLRGFRSPAPHRTDDSEIEYIPISPTLTKIRVHKKVPNIQEVKCYPVAKAEKEAQLKFKRQLPSFLGMGINPPAPPRRISSRNSRTLKLITSTRPASMSPKRQNDLVKHQSNVDFLKAKISNKLSRQNTQILPKKDTGNPKTNPKLSTKSRVQSISAPPAVNRKTTAINKTVVKRNGTDKQPGTSSFGSPRRTMLPAEYTNPLHTKYHDKPSSSVVIEGGAGRRTPITNILDKVTSLDKLWSSEKRNEPIDKQKARASLSKANSKVQLNPKSSTSKVSPATNGNRGRDMVRTAEKVQKMKAMSSTKPNPVVNKTNLSRSSNSMCNVSQSRKPYPVKTAVVTKLKKKQSLEDVTTKPRHQNSSNKKHLVNSNKNSTKKSLKSKKNLSKSSNDSESESQFGDISYDTSNFGSIEDLYGKRITAKEIRETRDAVMSDSFFQNLFLGSPCSSLITYPVNEVNTTVLQKAKMFQSYPQDYYSQKSINSYLIHRKPVTLSKFKIWDQHSGHMRAPSPRSVSWPGRMHGQVKKFESLSKPEIFGSCSSLASVRSKSEPPVNRLYFSQTSRPKSPSIIFVKKQGPDIISSRKSNDAINKIIFSQTSRPVSPKVVKTIRKPPKTDVRESVSPSRLFFSETVRPVSPVVRKRSTDIKDQQAESIWPSHDHDTLKKPVTLYFSQTSRPVSPRVERKATYPSVSRSESTSPIAYRSPSYRRITSSRQYPPRLECKVYRTQSAGDAEKRTPEKQFIVKTKSETNLQTNDPDYDEYVLDMQNNRARSERFRELNRYYSYLERVGELERATSTSDLRHRRKDEEIIDFDRWKKIRAIERAEQELHSLYNKLKMAQNENDVLFYPRDVNDFRWNLNSDRGLKIKEKSVEDLKDHFQKSTENLSSEPHSTRDCYKPLWRGKSVAETAFNINKDNKSTKKSYDKGKYSVPIKNDASLTEIRKKLGIGNCLWSSLSMDQVNALKDQLNAIYSKELESKLNKEKDMYSIDVPEKEKSISRSPLHVRSNSLISTSTSPTRFSKINKSESIAAICPLPFVKEIKKNANKSESILTESEKKKISQTLSNEVMKRLKKVEHAPLTLQQELEISENGHTLIENKENISLLSNTSTESVVEPTWQSKPRHVVFPPESNETAQQSSASETETGSSDVSNKTVIYKGSSQEVQEKIKYFESVKKSAEPKVVYHAREDSDEKSSPKSESKSKEPEIQQEIVPIAHSPIGQSQSCSDFKDLFGETDKNKYLSLPLNKSGKVSRSPSPRSEVYSVDRHAVDTTRYSSEETIWRSRSPSPDPERYWRAYLNLARAGEVRRLVRRFDSPGAPASYLRRHRSDPELSRIRCLTDWQSTDQLVSRSRLGHKTSLPVAKVPLRPGNRFMPHIDVISKLASLRRRTTTRSRSAEDTLECRQGEVDRIRRRFEVMSLLGQIYASAPDVSELRDIAPYLAGPWIAHQYPRKSDNTKPLKENSKKIIKPSKKELKTSKKSVKLSSILKSDLSSKQVYDPSLHRPVSRYEPPRAPPRPPPAAWPYFLAPYVIPSRHSVKFQGYFLND